jgi:uncharacterized protein YjbI with pentapeptide repeats
MVSEPHLRQKNRGIPILLGILVTVIVALIALDIAAYRYGWNWTGFIDFITPLVPVKSQYLPQQYLRGKTLWDWLQLLIVPIILGIVGFWLSQVQKQSEQITAKQRDKTDHDIAAENQREAALQACFDKLTELLLKEHLKQSVQGDEKQIIARTRTLTVLPHLDEIRKRSLLQFLHEARLIIKDKPLINLEGADLSKAKLDDIDLNNAYLHRTTLSEANLISAKLSNVDLSYADLTAANLNYVELTGADLNGAILERVNLQGAQLQRAYLGNAQLQQVDLRDAHLQSAILIYADLHDSYLSGANISKADLSRTNLSGANLSDISRGDANLRKRYSSFNVERGRNPVSSIVWLLFNLSPRRLRLLFPGQGADLSGANLTRANLSRAYLDSVDLRDTNLHWADLSGANLSGANLRGADLSFANLSNSKVKDEQLTKAKSLHGTIMPDGSIHH